MDRLPPKALLEDYHYLGAAHRAVLTYQDDDGVLVFAAPTARNLPKGWLELSRWCLIGGPNAGSRQWRAALTMLRRDFVTVTTIVSYSDPSVGHTGALYRACNWLWAPTWHRLFPTPTGNGSWAVGTVESVKDRWVALLRPDAAREAALAVDDTRIKRMPWAEYREPKWKRGRPQLPTGGGNYARWLQATEEPPPRFVAVDPADGLGQKGPRAPDSSSLETSMLGRPVPPPPPEAETYDEKNLTRVGPLTAGVGGQDLTQSGDRASPPLPKGTI